MRGTLIEIHTADLHFGAMDPRIQYEILMKEMINRIESLKFDAFYINGDIFHHKYMSNSDVVMYASMFIDQVVQLCRKNNATLVILHGTASHDANQLKLFYHYIGTVDIRIVEHIGFEIIKGKRVLCIPEEYNMGYDYYADKLFYSGYYDGVVMHGTIKNAIFGCNQVDLNSIKAPIFDLRCFGNCRGPIICGHVHIAKCYENHIYYSGSPLRWQFGEEQTKGFLTLLHNLDTDEYYVNLNEIESFRYDTINLDNMINCDPDEIIAYINSLRQSGIDFVKVKFDGYNDNVSILKRYYKTNFNVVIDATDIGFKETVQKNKEVDDKFQQYNYIFDKNLSPYDIFTRYVNQCKGYEFITVDELEKILAD